MSEEKSVPSVSKSITKKPCSWKQMFRKKHYEDLQKKEQLRKLGEEITRTEEFIKRAWTLIFDVISNQSQIKKGNAELSVQSN